jgi:diguanylate cyclase (GGDEF)-like protein/PAS domain S-box-containing protein
MKRGQKFAADVGGTPLLTNLGAGATCPATAILESDTRGLFDDAAIGITEIDVVEDRFIRVNRFFCDMVAIAAEKLLGDFDFISVIHPDDRAVQAEQWKTLQRQGQGFNTERRYVRPDGSILWGQLSVSVTLSDRNGRALRAIMFVQDVTQRKMAEAALRQSQDLLTLALTVGGVSTFRRDYQAGLIHCDALTRAMNALPPGSAPIPAEVWLRTVHPDDRERLLADFAEAHRQRQTITAFDYRFIHPEKGVRYAETRSKVEYDKDGTPLGSVGVIIDVTDRRRTETNLQHLAYHDPLTDLPNRSLFGLRLKERLERPSQHDLCAVLYLDLDNFKDVNDTLGHSVGDQLLREVTARLRSSCRPSDTVARLGGDEFAIIQYPILRRCDASVLAERIIAEIIKPYEVENHRVGIGTSIGIAVAPDDGVDPDRLLRSADMALYGAKAAGRGRFRFFEPAMDEKTRARHTLATDMRQALTDDAFEVFYQPIISFKTGAIDGFEALVRWQHPQRGRILPDAFIPLAEANGLIVPIGAFVLDRACRQALSWPGEMSVAVNISASEFSNPDLIGTVANALRESGLNPARLELEITESTILQDDQVTLQTLHGLKAIGVRVSIDDFGTGFSSLSYLQRFPFDKVKIDRSFIAYLDETPSNHAIVRAIIDLCADLGMKTTAEGIETQNQMRILSRMNCTEGQGYFVSRPRPASEISRFIESFERLALPAAYG